jgi:protein-S-isoprenylcysteine O-methyltransferase Ste14
MTLGAISSLVYLAFVAVFLAIRGVFMRRMRRDKAVSRNDTVDRVLVLLVGLGQVVLPILYQRSAALMHVADRPQFMACVVVGVVAMTVGVWLFRRSHVDLGDSWSVTLELNADHRLVTNGLYRRVRHPMYSSFLVLGVGQALLVPNWIAGLSGLASVLLLVAVRLPREEAMMVDQFGDQYRDYRRRTGAVLPRLSPPAAS